MFHPVAKKKLTCGLFLFFLESKYKVYPTYAKRAFAPVSPSSCSIDSIANPHLNDDPGTIIPFTDETCGLG
jgi:hypothetical protein